MFYDKIIFTLSELYVDILYLIFMLNSLFDCTKWIFANKQSKM